MMSLAKNFVLILGICLAAPLFAWGERGHHIVSGVAALLVSDLSSKEAQEKGLGQFFDQYVLALGHLSNVPDFSWRNRNLKPAAAKVGGPNHYFELEAVFGPSDKDTAAFLKHFQEIPADYDKFRKRFNGTPDKLTGGKVNVYSSTGTSPWRAQQLHELMKEALRCAKEKEKSDPAAKNGFNPALGEPFRMKPGGTKAVVPAYVCDRKNSRRADLYAAVVFAGILSHYIGDQSQPLHSSVDYDGRVTGNGGLHRYFETEVLGAADQGLRLETHRRSSDEKFRKSVFDKIPFAPEDARGVVRMMFALTADSLSHLDAVRKTDDSVAIVKRGTKLEWGGSRGEFFTYAKRKDPGDPAVQKAFRPMIVDRLATGSLLLARLWVSAWERAGKPDLSRVSRIDLPYPVDVPFIWPDYDPDAVK